MLDPVGPLPASIYWRRRALALAVVIVVLLLLWAVLPGGGDDRPRDTAAAAVTPGPTDPAAAPTGLSATAPSDDPGRPGDGDGDGSATGVGGTPTTSIPSPTPVPTTPRPTPPPAPTVCADSALQVTVSPRQRAYKVGQSPYLDLRIRNVSAVACLRDVSPKQQEIVLMRGSQRLWSSNDCGAQDMSRQIELLKPGVQLTSSVHWTGLGSRPKCAGKRTPIPAGTYTLVSRLGQIVSRRTPIVLR